MRKNRGESLALYSWSRIQEETKIHLPQFTVHTDDRWFNLPEQFRPERFRADRNDQRPDFAYFPFGGGPLQCMGISPVGCLRTL
ncbi:MULTISPECIES: cytochrome P450 [Salinibaculum]|uniref:cytochrome P450 n=1 Tax=Salinibaculum TaxID=2732368 RepID=UPI003612CE72